MSMTFASPHLRKGLIASGAVVLFLTASVALAAGFLPDALPAGFAPHGQVLSFGITHMGSIVKPENGNGGTGTGQAVVKRVSVSGRYKGNRNAGGNPVGFNPLAGGAPPPPEDPGDPGKADHWLRVDVGVMIPKGNRPFNLPAWGSSAQEVFEADNPDNKTVLVYDRNLDAYVSDWDRIPAQDGTSDQFKIIARAGRRLLLIESFLSTGGNSQDSDLPAIKHSMPGERTFFQISAQAARPTLKEGALVMLRAMQAHLPNLPETAVVPGDPGNWQTAVGTGAAGAAAVAAAAKVLAATLSKTKPTTKGSKDDDDSEEDEDPEEVIGHVLQIGTQQITLHLGETATVEVKVHEVTRAGGYRPARNARVSLSAPAWAGTLQIEPDQGGGNFTASLTLDGKAPSETAQLNVEAATPLGNHSAIINLTAAPEPTLECEPDHVELPAGKGGAETFTVWVENAGESEWKFDARFENDEAPLSVSIEDSDKPFAKYVKVSDAVKSGATKPTHGRDSHKLIITATGPALSADQEPLERHLAVILIWEGLFLLSVGRSNDERYHVKADGTEGDATVDVYGLAFDAAGKLEIEPARLGLDRLQFAPEEDTSERNKNLADAAQLEFTFVKFRPSNVPSAVWRIHATKTLPGGGGAIDLPLLASLPDRDPDPFSALVPLSLDTADTAPFSKAWETELERCRKIIDEFIPAGYRAQFHQLINQRKLLLGAEGLYELRRKIWRIAYELILAEGAEGYKNEALWADRVVTLLEYTEWGADMAFGAISGAVLGPYAPFAQFAKAQITSYLVAQAEGTSPESWLDAAWNQVKSTVEGKVIDIDTLEKLGTKNKAVLWAVYCTYYFAKGIWYDKKSITDAALDTLREVRDELLAGFFGSRVKAASGGAGDKPTEPGKAKDTDPQKTKTADPAKPKSDDSKKSKAPEPNKPKTSEPQKTKAAESEKPKSSEPEKAKTPEPEKPKSSEPEKAKTPEPEKPKSGEPDKAEPDKPKDEAKTEPKEKQTPKEKEKPKEKTYRDREQKPTDYKKANVSSEDLKKLTAGMPKVNILGVQSIANKYNVVILVRPTSKECQRWLLTGKAVPKPVTVKNKTINSLDVMLGAKPGHLGLVGHFEPTKPQRSDFPNLSDADFAKLEKRYQQRADEFKNQGVHLAHNDDVVVRGGLVFAKVWDPQHKKFELKPITGDHDLFDIRSKDGGPIDPALKDTISQEMDQFGVSHDCHMNWNYDHLSKDVPKGQKDSDFNISQGIDKTILDSHRQVTGSDQPGEPLITISGNEPIGAAWFNGDLPSTRE